ncbi:sigma-70 family RNA polymerase sigma factor [Pseudomonas cremoricolorata]|uniref:RNA polymerase sigma factor n=1 Tax=Pseudomonas cremoricolorata TaxID=157783 RepID=A0A089Y8F2_9PSED|nr:sigma-70 family RNA polymerase sigma factor [Pseudomonas cremoricolorata]AIR88118.1 RNA polymerase sigma factor [Pseudomonas cremoricolorata]
MDRPSTSAADDIAQLYAGHHHWLVAWLRRRLHCPHQASDFAHDTFYRLLSAGRYETPREPRAFLATVARRILIDNGRRLRLEQAYREALEQSLEHTEQAFAPEHILEAIELLERIDRALVRMKPRVRESFILRHLEGLSQEDIARHHGVTVRTVQADLVEAMLACDAAMQVHDA